MDRFLIRKNNTFYAISLWIFVLSIQSCAVKSQPNLNQMTSINPLKQYDLSTETYLIAPRDIIEVSAPVNKDDEKNLVLASSLSFEIIDGELFSRQRIEVNPFGEIDLPLIGSVKLVGLTAEQANGLLLQKLGKFYKKPKAFLKVVEYKGYDQRNKIAVMGEVHYPGVYAFQQHINLFEAVSLAGGYKNTANLNSVIIIQNGYAKKPTYLKINLGDVLNGQDISQNITVKAGDIIYVPDTYIAKLGNFVELFFSRIRPAAQTYLDFYAAGNIKGNQTMIITP